MIYLELPSYEILDQVTKVEQTRSTLMLNQKIGSVHQVKKNDVSRTKTRNVEMSNTQDVLTILIMI